jgi:cytochrome c-type biogenesis protein CcmH/NrfG
MGLLGALLTLPLAPARGVFWVAGQVADAADRELHDPDVLRARLAALNAELEAGLIGIEEFEREEEELLAGLEPARTVAVSSEKATQ